MCDLPRCVSTVLVIFSNQLEEKVCQSDMEREAVCISVRGAVQGATGFDKSKRVRAYCARVCAKERECVCVCGEDVQWFGSHH